MFSFFSDLARERDFDLNEIARLNKECIVRKMHVCLCLLVHACLCSGVSYIHVIHETNHVIVEKVTLLFSADTETV